MLNGELRKNTGDSNSSELVVKVKIANFPPSGIIVEAAVVKIAASSLATG